MVSGFKELFEINISQIGKSFLKFFCSLFIVLVQVVGEQSDA